MHREVVLAALLLSACGHAPTAEEKARQEERAIAEVEANQTPPPDNPTPQPISYSESERAGIHGAGCSFRPGGSDGNPIAIALMSEGFMRFDDEIQHFAPDSGSPVTPFGTYTKYDSGHYAMEWNIDNSGGKAAGMDTMEHKARLILRDGHGRVIFSAQGQAVCGA